MHSSATLLAMSKGITMMPSSSPTIMSPTKESLKSWFDSGVTCVGIGSKLIAKKANGDYDLGKITSLTKSSLEIIKELRL